MSDHEERPRHRETDLPEKIFIDRIKVILEILVRILGVWVVCGVVIYVGKQDCLRERGFYVFAGASITVSACANLLQKVRLGQRECWSAGPD